MHQLVSVHKRSSLSLASSLTGLISVSRSKNNSEVSEDSDITYMAVLIFFAIRDLKRKSSFLDRHQLTIEVG